MASSSVQVSEAQFPRDTQVVATLLLAYADALKVDLTFQSFQEELAQLPGKYAAENGGALLLAYHEPATDDGTEEKPRTGEGRTAAAGATKAAAAAAQPAFSSSIPTPSSSTASLSPPLGNCIGCIAIRRHQPTSHVCEFKRFYIVPEARRLGAGAILVRAAWDKARELGYKEGVLDTLRSMVAARTLYARYGFEETEKYYDNPLPDVVYYRAKL